MAEGKVGLASAALSIIFLSGAHSITSLFCNFKLVFSWVLLRGRRASLADPSGGLPDHQGGEEHGPDLQGPGPQHRAGQESQVDRSWGERSVSRQQVRHYHTQNLILSTNIVWSLIFADYSERYCCVVFVCCSVAPSAGGLAFVIITIRSM